MDPNHKMLLAAAALVAVMGVTYYFQKKSPILPVVPVVPSIPTAVPTPGVITVNLLPLNNSGISGTATLRELQGKAVVSLNLAGSQANLLLPGHIHAGSCPNPGAVKYPLINPVGGKSDTTLEVSLTQLKSELPLAINLHALQTETALSCGNITF